MQKHVLDTSVIIEGIASNLIKEKKLKGKVIITNASVAELENQANHGLEIGFIGLEELEKLQDFQKKKRISIEFVGPRPNIAQISLARSGEIDALIRSIAHDQKAVLVTADKVQAASAKAFGIPLKFIEMKRPELKLELEKYFDANTMSVHIKESCHITAKKGHPGDWKLEKMKDKLNSKQVQTLAKDAVEKTRAAPGCFVEIQRRGSTIAQFYNYRIVIVKPPVSDGWEITVVRPIKKLNLEDYKLPETLFGRIKNKAQGILISGETGSGKCLPRGTKVYLKNNIIKNIEDIKIGDKVLTYNKYCKVIHSIVTKTFKRKVNKTIIIKTNFGKEIELTPEHPILSFKNGMPAWVEANELEVDNRIATVRKLDNEGGIQEIKWVDSLPEDKILVKIKKDYNKELEIEDTLLGLSKKIVKIIKKKKRCNLKGIHKELKSESGWISYLLPRLVNKGILKREKVSKYLYSLKTKRSKIKRGDILPLSGLKKYLKDEEIYNISEKICKFDTWHKCNFIIPPKYVTKELCELLGYYLGESLTKYGISTDSKFCRERFKELSKSIFGIEIDKKRRQTDVYTDKYGSIELFLNKCFEISLLKSKKRATYHRIPKLIFNSPKIEIASFLRAYFDTEGYVHKSKGIEICSASIGLIRDTQTALLNFNIQSSIREKIINNKSYYTLYIYGYENVKRFREEIGLIEKNWQIERYIKNNKPGSPNKDTIPIAQLLCSINKRESFGLYSRDLKGRGDFSHGSAQKLISIIGPKIKSGISLIELAMIELASSDYIQWDKVVSITEKNEIEEVYDIEVEGTHNFLAGEAPFIVHNSTFAQSIAEFYAKNGRITKTVESPRDLQLSNEITQYSKNFTTSEEIHDILFLSRPDNIIFDEIRDTPDFALYIDLRLAGSSCIGVLHSASPIDAIQRFIGRTETGMIPSVVDTLMFVEAGKIKKVLTLKMKVKVPSGMVEQDLARPVVEVRDFETNKLEYEIYSYGEETVVVPVEAENSSSVNALALKLVEQEFRRYGNIKAELIDANRVRVYVPKSRIGEIIGREGSNIDFVEKKLGISIDVEEIKERQEQVKYDISETKKHLIFKLENKYTKKRADFYIGNEFVLSAIVGTDGEIRINKKSEPGRSILDALDMNKNVEIRI